MQAYRSTVGWSASALRRVISGLSAAAFLLLITAGPNLTLAQDKKASSAPANNSANATRAANTL